jgi:hypothetical protein
MDVSVLDNGVGDLNWRKSARSINAGNCTEVASSAGAVAVRDSQDPHGLVLRYPAATWRAFLDGTRAGRFDPAARG